jgi:RNA polymerase subunit RPABC4/transcription elongation factor Spt4
MTAPVRVCPTCTRPFPDVDDTATCPRCVADDAEGWAEWLGLIEG